MLEVHALSQPCTDTPTTMIQVWVEKAKFYQIHHIQSLDESSLAKQIYSEQLSHGWPGLVTECRDLIKQWKIPNIITGEIDCKARSKSTK